MMDPRRLGEHDSDLSEEDQGDVLCILHPASPSAMAVASRIVESAPQHTISRAQMPIRVLGADDDQPIVQPNTMELAEQGLVTRDLALRLSAELKDPLAGFTFGRNEQRCDFVFNYATTDGAKRISNIHFRIWLSEAGIIMLEDQSTNGTWVEGKHLRSKNRESNPQDAISTLLPMVLLSSSRWFQAKMMMFSLSSAFQEGRAQPRICGITTLSSTSSA